VKSVVEKVTRALPEPAVVKSNLIGTVGGCKQMARKGEICPVSGNLGEIGSGFRRAGDLPMAPAGFADKQQGLQPAGPSELAR